MHTKKPTVLEEIIIGLDYFRCSLFEAVCTTYKYVENSLNVSTECELLLHRGREHSCVFLAVKELYLEKKQVFVP